MTFLNKKIDMITVESIVKYNSHNVAIYDCLCDCGQRVQLKETQLKAISYKNCGCLKIGRTFEGVPIENLLNTEMISKRSNTGFQGVCKLNKSYGVRYSATLIFKEETYKYEQFDTLSDAVKYRLELEIRHLDPVRKRFWEYIEENKENFSHKK